MANNTYDSVWFRGTETKGAETPEYWGDGDAGNMTPMKTAIDIISRLYNVERRGVAFANAQTDEWTETNRGIALVNPYVEAGGDGRLVWHIPTSTYAPAGPDIVYAPMVGAIADADVGEAFGQVRVYRGGGEQHVDVFFTGKTLEIADTTLTLGLSTNHDYFGGRKHTASVVAFDHSTGMVMRDLTEPRARKHTGASPATVGDWWADLIGRVDDTIDALGETIAESQAYEIDIADMPTDAEGFYSALGLPDYLAAAAGNRSRLDGGPRSAYELYKSGVETMETEFDAKTGGRVFRKYVKAFNTLLFSPPAAEESVLRELAENADGRETLAGTDAADLIERADTVAEGAEFFESKRDKLRAMLEHVETNDESESDESDADDADADPESDGSETAADGSGGTSSGSGGMSGEAATFTDGGWESDDDESEVTDE